MYFATGLSKSESILNLVGVFFVFLLILAAAYYTSRVLGKSNLLQPSTQNIEVIETFRLNQSKYIQILKIGKRYVAVCIGKEHTEVLMELSKDDLMLDSPEKKTEAKVPGDFKEVLSHIIKKHKK